MLADTIIAIIFIVASSILLVKWEDEINNWKKQ